MTDAHHYDNIDGPHEGPIKTPKQLILAIIFSFAVPIVAIVLLVIYVTTEKRPSAGTEALTSPQAIEQRIRPIGTVEVKDAGDLASLKPGDQVYAAQCAACHAAGALNAPKLGDAEAWGARIRSGYPALLHSSLAGKGQMPPQGGGDFTDFEIARAVVYMANQAGGKFAEPAAPAPTSAAASAPAGSVTVATATATAPRADANAGTPIAGPTAALNAQVRAAAPNAVPTPPGGTTTVVAAATPPALYAQVCSACHIAGLAGAPKLGDKAAWAPRIAQGIDAMTATVVKGKGAMPPKGGSTASEAELKTLVSWMASQAK